MSPRIIFMGTPEFAVPVLTALAAEYGAVDNGVVGVVTVPDRKKGRGQRIAYSPVKEEALKLGFVENTNIFQPDSLKEPEFIENLDKLKADIFCVVAFRILPEAVFSLPNLASFNIHGSLLPLYRGAAPINRAIMNGENQTGLTTFILQKKVDTGSVLHVDTIKISENMTAGELHDIMMHKAAGIAIQTIETLASSKYEATSQNDENATPAPKIFRDDCKINFAKSSQEVHNHIRGLSPYPAAWTVFNSKITKVMRSIIVSNTDSKLKPAEYSIENGKLLVGTGAGGVIELLEIKPEGKKAVQVQDYLLGYRGEHSGIIGS